MAEIMPPQRGLPGNGRTFPSDHVFLALRRSYAGIRPTTTGGGMGNRATRLSIAANTFRVPSVSKHGALACGSVRILSIEDLVWASCLR
jgi:hypothetical protein